MAFFGITNLGYQYPIGDKMLTRRSDRKDGLTSDKMPGLPPISSPSKLQCTDICSVKHQPRPHSTDIHHGSQKRYKEMLRRIETPQSPNELYSVPLTDNQHYGWWLQSSDPDALEDWAKVRRFPRKDSEMTKFVKEMSMTDREFSLF